MSRTSGRPADIADRQRVWEVRRFCQVRTAHPPPSACGEDSQGDAALSALLRCLLYELDADLAAVTLLDDQTQHFLSVVHKAHIHDAHIRTTKWYGCDQISHHGGICEKTIAIQQTPGEHQVYEILDLAAEESTKSLPVVNGKVADFRHYAGVPLNTPEGLNVGTVFVFRKEAPTEPLPLDKRRFLVETANHAMHQLLQTVEALEYKRSLRCNAAVTSMLDSHISTVAPDPTRSPGTAKATKLYTSFAQEIHTTAVDLLNQVFQLDGVTIQELPLTNLAANVCHPQRDSKVLATACNPGIRKPGPINDDVAQQLLEAFPNGGVFHVLEVNESGKFVASAQRKPGFYEKVQLDLCEGIPKAEQFVFMPLRDSFHDRDVAFVLGWVSDFARVYTGATDLPPLASFGMAIMTQVRRLEAQLLSRNKSDFLGSMSHEVCRIPFIMLKQLCSIMRSPLHGMLACIDLLLRDTKCSDKQLDLLESAEACGLQLRGNIDNILLYSNIGSPSPRSEKPRVPHLVGFEDDHGKNTMLALIEDTIGRDTRKRKSTLPARSTNGLLWTNDNCKDASRSDGTVITVDANPQADFPLIKYSGISVIVNNLLGNCLKFTGTDMCVRVSLEADAETVKLSFIDAGRGMTSDFVKHNLLVPFAQQDPLDTGTGLGLSLVQSAVQALGGETKIDTDESRGTEVSVILPRSRLAGDEDALAFASHVSATTRDVSSLQARLFAPARWHREDDLRHQRCIESLDSSLGRTLRCWLGMDFGVWDCEELPDVMFVLYSDLERLEAITKHDFRTMHKVVLCSDLHAEKLVQKSQPLVYTTIVGPITSSKVCAAILSQPENLTNGDGAHLNPSRNGSITGRPASTVDENGEENDSTAISPGDRTASLGLGLVDGPAELHLPDRTIAKAPELPTEPRFLLVDDNNINLKVIGMYAKKCSKRPSASAGGGQEAIDAFKLASLAPSPDQVPANRFDIILLDLSMPEVSGFDVAAAVRKYEQENGSKRTYIAALTGLVSDKDRAAAFAAGVDEYVTKPATLKDVQGVVASWRATLEAPP